MRGLIVSIVLSFIVILAGSEFAGAEQKIPPSTAGGFTLKSSIEDYRLESYENYLNEIIIKDLEGYHKAFITYGTCENPGKILRIKLKYENRSRDFFEQLIKRYKEAFGAKPKFAGDQFGNVKSWVWSFTNEEGQRVKLVLQHNLKDTDESIGNMVKLSLPDLMSDERQCFNKKYPPKDSQAKTEYDWDLFIPK